MITKDVHMDKVKEDMVMDSHVIVIVIEDTVVMVVMP